MGERPHQGRCRPCTRCGPVRRVVAAVVRSRIVGASVGSCGAWLIDESLTDLTERQVPGAARRQRFSHARRFRGGAGRLPLLLASDGLLKYASREYIVPVARNANIQAAPRELAELPRLHGLASSPSAKRPKN